MPHRLGRPSKEPSTRLGRSPTERRALPRLDHDHPPQAFDSAPPLRSFSPRRPHATIPPRRARTNTKASMRVRACDRCRRRKHRCGTRPALADAVRVPSTNSPLRSQTRSCPALPARSPSPSARRRRSPRNAVPAPGASLACSRTTGAHALRLKDRRSSHSERDAPRAAPRPPGESARPDSTRCGRGRHGPLCGREEGDSPHEGASWRLARQCGRGRGRLEWLGRTDWGDGAR